MWGPSDLGLTAIFIMCKHWQPVKIKREAELGRLGGSVV